MTSLQVITCYFYFTAKEKYVEREKSKVENMKKGKTERECKKYEKNVKIQNNSEIAHLCNGRFTSK